MQQYHQLLKHIRANGIYKGDRTGTGTQSVFGYQMRFNLADGFPIVTTKRIHLKSIIHELLWFLSGDTNVKYLQDNGVSIWDDWAPTEDVYREVDIDFGARIALYAQSVGMRESDAQRLVRGMGTIADGVQFLDNRGVAKTASTLHKHAGDLGPVYGHQWRNYGATKNKDGSFSPDGVDQITALINRLRTHPDCRRLIVTGWNPAEANQVALPPCHTLFQFYTRELTFEQRFRLLETKLLTGCNATVTLPPNGDQAMQIQFMDNFDIPKRALDCQLYQRKEHCALAA